MSRLGKKPVEIPAGVSASINGRTISISGPNGTLEYTHRPEVSVQWDESEKCINVSIDESRLREKQVRAYWGLTRALLDNMVVGVTKGYQKQLEVVGVGYTAELRGQKIALKVGFANTIEMPIPQGVDVTIERQIITVKGADKQAVGQFAAQVRATRKPEPYNGKGIKYLTEVVKRKQGKAFGS
jgi:large subunit ribosomal protein L6